jgi:hypothetical protein
MERNVHLHGVGNLACHVICVTLSFQCGGHSVYVRVVGVVGVERASGITVPCTDCIQMESTVDWKHGHQAARHANQQ